MDMVKGNKMVTISFISYLVSIDRGTLCAEDGALRESPPIQLNHDVVMLFRAWDKLSL